MGLRYTCPANEDVLKYLNLKEDYVMLYLLPFNVTTCKITVRYITVQYVEPIIE